MQELVSFFEQQGFPEAETADIVSRFKRKIFLKNEHFVEEGKVNKYLGYITKGVFQFYFNHHGDEKTTYISGAHNFIVSLSSFLKQIPSKENIKAVAEAEVWIIPKKAMDDLIDTYENFKSFYIGMLEHQITCIDDSRFNLIALTAEERYQKLLAEEPELLQQIPLQYMATMLGITPRHLSRIRKNIH